MEEAYKEIFLLLVGQRTREIPTKFELYQHSVGNSKTQKDDFEVPGVRPSRQNMQFGSKKFRLSNNQNSTCRGNHKNYLPCKTRITQEQLVQTP